MRVPHNEHGSPSDLITYEEAANILTVSQATVRRLCLLGKITLMVISPRCHRVSRRSVDTYIREARYSPPVPTPPKSRISKQLRRESSVESLREVRERALQRFATQSQR